MQKTKKGYAFNPKAIQRREKVIQRLENQLKSGIKPDETVAFFRRTKHTVLPLEKQDVVRIEKELTTLKSRI